MEGFGYEKKIRIMIVDENSEFRSYTANKLRNEVFDIVLTTADPKSALDAIPATSPDVVLFDIILAGLDGIAFLEQALKIPLSRRPRCIATSTAVNEMMIKDYNSGNYTENKNQRKHRQNHQSPFQKGLQNNIKRKR